MEKIAKGMDGKLTAEAFQQNECVIIQHNDGSSFIFRCAFMIKRDEYIIVFTEHNGYHIFHKDDLSFYTNNNKNPFCD